MPTELVPPPAANPVIMESTGIQPAGLHDHRVRAWPELDRQGGLEWAGRNGWPELGWAAMAGLNSAGRPWLGDGRGRALPLGPGAICHERQA